MIKRYNIESTNVSNAATMIINSSKKRRMMAISAAKTINSETGLSNKLTAVKY